MSALAYLRSHASAFVTFALFALVAGLVLVASGLPASTVALVLACAALATACALVLGYLRRRPFYRQLADLERDLDNPLLMCALLEDPPFAEGQAAYDALELVTRAANDEVAASRRQVDEYRAYVETWVHEAKSPLAAAHLVLENLAADPASVARDPSRLDAIADELHRVEGYVEQALFYARSETLEQDYLIRRHVLRDLVSAAVRANARELIEARVAPRLGEGLDAEVFADDKWVAFVLGQVIQNAVRYVRPDETSRELSFSACVVGRGLSDGHVELEVRDNGCGCSAADLARVFEKGFTGDNGRTHKRSTGLGLWLVRRLCDKMGLAVSADSVEGAWFAVRVSFPVNGMHLLS